jgi:hypothetical protein
MVAADTEDQAEDAAAAIESITRCCRSRSSLDQIMAPDAPDLSGEDAATSRRQLSQYGDVDKGFAEPIRQGVHLSFNAACRCHSSRAAASPSGTATS